jgi:hypothetical protein
LASVPEWTTILRRSSCKDGTTNDLSISSTSYAETRERCHLYHLTFATTCFITGNTKDTTPFSLPDNKW